MIIAFTGAGISRASGIPTFGEQPGIRDYLSRDFARKHPDKYKEVINNMKSTCDQASPNDAHIALAQYDIPIITMNVDGLHQRAGSKHVLPIHGTLPNIVLYGDPAPLYQTAFDWVYHLQEGDFFLIVGTSYYTNISTQLKITAFGQGADVVEINEDAEHAVREFLSRAELGWETFEEFLGREGGGPPMKSPYSL